MASILKDIGEEKIIVLNKKTAIKKISTLFTEGDERITNNFKKRES